MDIETMKKTLEDKVNWFLGTYNPDSSVRVSKRAFEDIFSLAREFSIAKNKCNHIPPHPVVNILYAKFDEKEVVLVAAEMRSGQMTAMRESRENAVKAVRDLPPHLPEDRKREMISLFMVRTHPVTIDGLADMGVRPFDLVLALKQAFEREDFFKAAAHATQDIGFA